MRGGCGVKIDLHRHLGGSIRPTTVYEILQKQGKKYALEVIQENMLYKNDDVRTFRNFLNKFNILNEITWDENALGVILEQICYDVSNEKIDYFELKFSLDKYLKHGWTDIEVMKFIHEKTHMECDKWDIDVGLILSFKHECEEKVKISKNVCESVSELVDGIDIIGDESKFDIVAYKQIFDMWRGKCLQAHVGETQAFGNIVDAIKILKVNRVVHGVSATDDVLRLARDNDVCFDVSLTSNVLTGVIKDYKSHPIERFIKYVDITIGTDDPVILNTSLDKEYEIVSDVFKFDDDIMIKIMQNSEKYRCDKK